MEFNFNDLKPVKVSNHKVGGGRQALKIEYSGLRYRRMRSVKKVSKDSTEKVTSEFGKFYVSDDKFKELGLENYGLMQFVHPTTKQVFLCVVNHEDAVILRKTEKGEKGSNFKSDVLEEALAATGVINTKDMDNNQIIELQQVGENQTLPGNIFAYKILIPKFSGLIPVTKIEKKAKAPAEGPANAEQPVKQTVEPVDTASQAPASDWD